MKTYEVSDCSGADILSEGTKINVKDDGTITVPDLRAEPFERTGGVDAPTIYSGGIYQLDLWPDIKDGSTITRIYNNGRGLYNSGRGLEEPEDTETFTAKSESPPEDTLLGFFRKLWRFLIRLFRR